MGVAFFPVVACSGQASIDGVALRADEVESGWSMASRLARVQSQRAFGLGLYLRDDWRATFDNGTRRITLSGPTFTLSMGLTPNVTGFSSGTYANGHTGSALSDVVPVEGVRLSSPGWSSSSAGIGADGSSVGPSTWRSGSIVAEVAVSYADAWTAMRTLRRGTWDVVSEDLWLGRIRVTGTSVEPQGRLAGVVQLSVQGVSVP